MEDDPPTKASGFVWILSRMEYHPFIDIRSRVVSHRPDGWSGNPKTEGDEMPSVSGADLEGLDLRSMGAERAFLAKANLRKANLTGAYLRFANLREADLTEAILRYAYLRGASFRDANLQGADLINAIFSRDEKDPTKMIGPNFQGAKIDSTTKLTIEDLIEFRVNNLALAYLGDSGPGRLAALHKAGFPRNTDGELSQGRLLRKTFSGLAMAGADFTKFDLTESIFTSFNENEADLSGALFIGANLTKVTFSSVNLQGADFSQANLDGTTFASCKLQGAVFNNVKGNHIIK